MKLLNSHTHIHGFEDYKILSIGESCFTNTQGFYLPWHFDTDTYTYLINRDLPVKVIEDNSRYSYLRDVRFIPELVTDHKELLNTAKKVYTHPCCNLSRSMMGEKYKKSLNPFLSDAVIIPKPNYNQFILSKKALFINEQAKIILTIYADSDDAINHISNAHEGDKFISLISCSPSSYRDDSRPFNVSDVLDSEFFYYGEVLCIPNSQHWALEILTHQLPADKIVFEESVQESLGTESNQLDFDSLCSIMDMLNSSDEDTVSAGLKSLSMMDWMHYPQSVKFILNNTDNKWNWVYNKACNSTSVKYMMQTITGGIGMKRNRWPGYYDREIYEEDFELFKKLKCHYHHILPQDIMQNIRDVEFLTVNSEGFMVPNIKQRN